MSGYYGNTPSVKALMRHWDKNTAHKVKALMDRKADPETYESVQAWVHQCYNEPSKLEQRLCAINEALNGYGVEVIGDMNQGDDNKIHAEYINMGDTYSATILFDRHRGRFQLTTWGDWVETFERNGGHLR